ncbi:MAG: insulinase family protein [Bradyrhizobiaceae bacterium]|nr:insulinase family protein [Bradyrhizobiaceae bacterium]
MTVALMSAAPTPSWSARIDRIVTPAGIEVWHVRDNTLPMVSMEFGFVGGAAQDPEAKPGVANLMASLLDEGAGDLDARAFQERLEERAIALSFSAQRDALRGSLKTLIEHREQAVELLRLALAQPRFDAEAVERVRAATLAGIRRRTTNPSDIAGDRWFARAFPNHPYGRPSRGTLDSVASITTDDLRVLHANTVARSNLKIATIGALDAADIAALVDRAFAGLPAKAKLTPVPEAVPQGAGERDIVDMDVPQTVITFGGAGLKRSDPDFIPAFVLNHILGGGSFSSRLYREVREKRGLAYSVYSYLAPLDRAGLFLGGVSTRNDRAAESLTIILEEIRRIAGAGPTAEELAKAKSYLIGSYPLRFDTSGKIAEQLLQIQLDDLGIDYIDRRNGLIEAVTADDVRRAAARFLADAKLLVTLVGRPNPAPSISVSAPGGRG